MGSTKESLGRRRQVHRRMVCPPSGTSLVPAPQVLGCPAVLQIYQSPCQKNKAKAAHLQPDCKNLNIAGPQVRVLRCSHDQAFILELGSCHNFAVAPLRPAALVGFAKTTEASKSKPHHHVINDWRKLIVHC